MTSLPDPLIIWPAHLNLDWLICLLPSLACAHTLRHARRQSCKTADNYLCTHSSANSNDNKQHSYF